MIALRLVRLIERHANNLAEELIEKLRASARTSDMQKVPEAELRSRIHEILEHLGEWLLTKTGSDVEIRYRDLGARRAAQGAEFLQRQGFLRSPVEIYGELELLRLLDQFFDRALCYATEGYEQHSQLPSGAEIHAGQHAGITH